MAWSNKTQIITNGSVAASEVFSSAVRLEHGQVAHIEVEADFPATPTDNLLVSVYGTLDDSTENWDDTYYAQYTLDKGTDPNKLSFVVEKLYKFRVGCKRSGTTDTITVNAYVRKAPELSV